MKTKIIIKSIFGPTLFEYEKENNTIKDTLQEAVNRGINLYCADLCNADLCCANLGNANLRGADLRSADLSCADLRSADLHGSDLCCANLCCANLDSADLYCADLHCAYLDNTNLSRVNLSGANLSCAYLYGACLENASLGSWGNLKGSSDILTIGTIGSRNSYTTIYHTDKGIFVQCGCFSGTLEEFVAKVKEKHQENKYERDYLALVEFAKIKFEL